MITRRNLLKGLGAGSLTLLGLDNSISKAQNLERILNNENDMPNYWMYEKMGNIIPFKDIAGNELLKGNHDSFEYVFNSGILCSKERTNWYGFNWGWIYRTGVQEGNSIYRRIPIISLLGQQEIDGIDYILDKGDIYDNHYNWEPYKKISKVNWSLNDPISQFVREYKVPYNDCVDTSSSDPLVIEGENTWVIKEALSELNNEFFDGTSKDWKDRILHVQEYEHYFGNLIDYWLKFEKGLIRLKITTELGKGYTWLESGAC